MAAIRSVTTGSSTPLCLAISFSGSGWKPWIFEAGHVKLRTAIIIWSLVGPPFNAYAQDQHPEYVLTARDVLWSAVAAMALNASVLPAVTNAQGNRVIASEQNVPIKPLTDDAPARAADVERGTVDRLGPNAWRVTATGSYSAVD